MNFWIEFKINLIFLGVAQIIRWEQALEKGENIEAEVSQIGLPKTVTIEVFNWFFKNMPIIF